MGVLQVGSVEIACEDDLHRRYANSNFINEVGRSDGRCVQLATQALESTLVSNF